MTSAAAHRWIAAGVRHELLMRALPAVRHDLAAPLSLMRMQLLTLRRQAGAGTPVPSEALAPRLARFEVQVAELSEGLRSLRDWELPPPGAAEPPGLSRAALVAQGVALMRAPFELEGLVLQVDPALGPQDRPEGEAAPVWPGAVALRYLLLGALCHLRDAYGAPGALRLSAVGPAQVHLAVQPRPAAEGAAPGGLPGLAAGRLPIDAASLQALAADLGHAVAIAPGAVTLDLRRR